LFASGSRHTHAHIKKQNKKNNNNNNNESDMGSTQFRCKAGTTRKKGRIARSISQGGDKRSPERDRMRRGNKERTDEGEIIMEAERNNRTPKRE
jgi:hypothetical protein